MQKKKDKVNKKNKFVSFFEKGNEKQKQLLSVSFFFSLCRSQKKKTKKERTTHLLEVCPNPNFKKQL